MPYLPPFFRPLHGRRSFFSIFAHFLKIYYTFLRFISVSAPILSSNSRKAARLLQIPSFAPPSSNRLRRKRIGSTPLGPDPICFESVLFPFYSGSFQLVRIDASPPAGYAASENVPASLFPVPGDRTYNRWYAAAVPPGH